MQGILGYNSDNLPCRVFELPGEPAVVINGVPDIPIISDGYMTTVDSTEDGRATGKAGTVATVAESSGNPGFGEWLEGREVRKLFGKNYYLGSVTKFDKETGWYRVVYEDGDFEDLEWHELQAVLQPLDITVPLKSLALKIIRKNQKLESGSGRKVWGDQKIGSRSGGRRGRVRGNSPRP